MSSQRRIRWCGRRDRSGLVLACVALPNIKERAQGEMKNYKIKNSDAFLEGGKCILNSSLPRRLHGTARTWS